MFPRQYGHIYPRVCNSHEHSTAMFLKLYWPQPTEGNLLPLILEMLSILYYSVFVKFSLQPTELNFMSCQWSQSEIHSWKDVHLPDPLTVNQFVSKLFLLQTRLHDCPHTGLQVHMHRTFSTITRGRTAGSKHVHILLRGKRFENAVGPGTTRGQRHGSPYTHTFLNKYRTAASMYFLLLVISLIAFSFL